MTNTTLEAVKQRNCSFLNFIELLKIFFSFFSFWDLQITLYYIAMSIWDRLFYCWSQQLGCEWGLSNDSNDPRRRSPWRRTASRPTRRRMQRTTVSSSRHRVVSPLGSGLAGLPTVLEQILCYSVNLQFCWSLMTLIFCPRTPCREWMTSEGVLISHTVLI